MQTIVTNFYIWENNFCWNFHSFAEYDRAEVTQNISIQLAQLVKLLVSRSLCFIYYWGWRFKNV